MSAGNCRACGGSGQHSDRVKREAAGGTASRVERLKSERAVPALLARKPNPYHGCTTHGCEWGFNGTERHMPAEWDFCPKCGGELAEITMGLPPAFPTSPAA